jgi:flavin-binding protein dodecin
MEKRSCFLAGKALSFVKYEVFSHSFACYVKGWRPASGKNAAQQAVGEASNTLRNIRSVHLKEFEAAVENGKIIQYRINAKNLVAPRIDQSRLRGHCDCGLVRFGKRFSHCRLFIPPT